MVKVSASYCCSARPMVLPVTMGRDGITAPALTNTGTSLRAYCLVRMVLPSAAPVCRTPVSFSTNIPGGIHTLVSVMLPLPGATMGATNMSSPKKYCAQVPFSSAL